MSRCLVLVVLLAACLIVPSMAHGGGIFHVHPPQIQGRTVAVARPEVLLSKTAITISETFLECRIDQTFFNDNEFDLEGLYVLPLAKEESSIRPEVTINGVAAQWKIVPPQEFLPTLRQLTLEMHDPSLLGLAGKDLLVIRPLRIGARRQKSLRIQYQRPLSLRDDEVELTVPLDGERYAKAPVPEFEIRARFKMARPVRTVFSTTHHLSVLREAPHRCLVAVASTEKPVGQDLHLLTTFSGSPLNLRLFCHRDQGKEGSFMIFVEPPPGAATSDEPDKDVVFVMDTSGSVTPLNLELAKRLVTFGLERLRPRDRFNVLTVSTRTGRMAPGLLSGSTENVVEAVKFVNAVSQGGGTDLGNGLINALEEFGSRARPNIVVYVGDGQSSVGIIDPESILEEIQRANRARARIFTFGIGERADMTLLDKISVATGGSSLHFVEKDDFGSAMNRFFAGVTPPQVADLSLRSTGTPFRNGALQSVPDLFGQESGVLLGRYTDSQPVSTKVELRGKLRGKLRTMAPTFTFPQQEHRYPYIPTLWAMRQVGILLDRLRLKGPDPGVAEQAQALARMFGFRLPPLVAGSGGRPPLETRDAGGLLWRFKTSCVAAEVYSDDSRHVGTKIFRRENGGWVDCEYQPSQSTRTAVFLSDEYFALLAADPQLGPDLAIGAGVTVVRPTGAVRVVPEP